MDRDRLDALCAAWVAGDLDDAGHRELEAVLRADDAARRVFATWCQGEMALGQLLRERRSGSEAALEDECDGLCAAFLAGDLEGPELARFEQMLRSDDGCRRRLASWCASDMALGQTLREQRVRLPDDEVFDELCAGAMANSLSDPDQQWLEDILRHDPRSRQRFAAWCRGDMVLGTVIQEQRQDRIASAFEWVELDEPERQRSSAASSRSSRRSSAAARRPPLKRTPASRRKPGRQRNVIPFWGVAAAAAALIVAVILIDGAPSATAPGAVQTDPAIDAIALVRGLHGQATVDGRPLQIGDELPAGSELRCAADGRITLRWISDGSDLRLDGESAFRVVGDDLRGRLLAGRCEARVRKQGPGEGFAIQGPHAGGRVMGTVFVMTHDGETTELWVREGQVRFTAVADGTWRDVTAGGHARATAAGLVAEQVAAVEPEPAAQEPERPEPAPIADDPVAEMDSIQGFRFVDAQGRTLRGLADGDTIAFDTLPDTGCTIVVDCTDDVKSVQLRLWGPTESAFLLEQYEPFSIFGDQIRKGGEFVLHRLQPGRYTLRVAPRADFKGEQALGDPQMISFTISR